MDDFHFHPGRSQQACEGMMVISPGDNFLDDHVSQLVQDLKFAATTRQTASMSKGVDDWYRLTRVDERSLTMPFSTHPHRPERISRKVVVVGGRDHAWSRDWTTAPSGRQDPSGPPPYHDQAVSTLASPQPGRYFKVHHDDRNTTQSIYRGGSDDPYWAFRGSLPPTTTLLEPPPTPRPRRLPTPPNLDEPLNWSKDCCGGSNQCWADSGMALGQEITTGSSSFISEAKRKHDKMDLQRKWIRQTGSHACQSSPTTY